ncbi:MAG: bifunctional adenosylcobinamide kinase/adenosylcobinamide-phosphate guanylyltransferase [Steroidobacteraceae bacterium]
MPERHLILGAARSGKTRHAIELATSLASMSRGLAPAKAGVAYVATAQALDAEMEERIARHRAERPVAWTTVEAARDLADTLRAQRAAVLIVDCMTLWLSNALLVDFDERVPGAPLPSWEREREALLQWLAEFRGTIVLVSNEVGAGIVPASALARRIQDEQGRLNQALGAVCERVTLVVAGIAMRIKG